MSEGLKLRKNLNTQVAVVCFEYLLYFGSTSVVCSSNLSHLHYITMQTMNVWSMPSLSINITDYLVTSYAAFQ
jgi:hypothetical protein